MSLLVTVVVADAAAVISVTVMVDCGDPRIRLWVRRQQLLQDLKTLRSLLDYVFRYDAVTFYEQLLREKKKASAVREPPLWIGTPVAERWGCTRRVLGYSII